MTSATHQRSHGGRTLLLWTLVLTIVTTALSTWTGVASAHRNDESYIYLDVGDSTLAGRVELPYGDMRTLFDMRLAGSPDEVLGELEARLGELQSYMADHTRVGDGVVDWPITFDGVELLFEEDVDADGLGYGIFPFDIDLGGADVPPNIDISFTPFLAEIDDRNNVALISNDWKRGVIDQESNELAVLTEGSPTTTIDLGNPSQWRNFRASMDLGVDHIRTGPDHIFFVFVLLLPSVLVLLAGTWRPAPSFSGSLLRVVAVATMFTIAHSLTFTLAGLDILPLPPSKIVESLIALSIAAAALHNLKPIFGHREWTLAFVFGLFHGMGFAGLVEDLDIDRSTQLVSLLGRNVGIEIGQLVIILISFPALFLLRRTRAYLPAMYAASIGLAVISSIWVIERLFEVSFGIDGGVVRALQWPRSLFVVIVLTAVVIVYRNFEERRGRLLPVGTIEADEAGDAETEIDHEAVNV